MDIMTVFSFIAFVLIIVLATIVVVLFVRLLRFIERKTFIWRSSPAAINDTDKSVHKPSKGFSWQGVIISLVFIMGAIIVIPRQIQNIRGNINSKGWTSIRGKVITSEVERGWSTSDEVSYCAKVAYRYFVGGMIYTGDTIRFGGRCFNDFGQAQRDADLYPKGEDVLIYFDPDVPEDSVLEPGGSLWSPILQILISFVIGVSGSIYLIVGFREKLSG